jgi:fructose 1,6-bisphosphatase
MKCTEVVGRLVGRDISVGNRDWLRAGRSGDRIPVRGEIIHTSRDRLWGPPSLLYNGYQVFSGVKSGPVVTLTPHTLLVPLVMKE